MKKIILRILYILQFHRIARLLNRNKVIILMYHAFTDKTQFDGIANYHHQNLNMEIFRKQIEYLKNNYRIISLQEYIESVHSKGKTPQNSVIITIDDGYRSNYLLAFPVLKESHIPATIFITTSFVDNKLPLWADRIEYAINKTSKTKLELEYEKLSFDLTSKELKISCDKKIKAFLKLYLQEQRDKLIEGIENTLDTKLSINDSTDEIYQPLSWNEINEMLQSGSVSMGSHTHSHFILSRCTPQTAENEMRLSKKIIEEKTGNKCDLFCYPNGKQNDFNDETERLVKRTGYKCALTTISGMNSIDSNPYELKRIGIGDEEDMIEFIMKISGVMHSLQKIKKIFSR